MPMSKEGSDTAMKIVYEKLPEIIAFKNEQDGKYLVGNEPTWPDFYFFEMIELFAYMSNG